jgi:hypothetical protein
VQSLHTNESLDTLDVSANKIGDTGKSALA